MISTLLILSGIGFLIASYSLYGYLRSHADHSYRSLCDLGKHASCSRSFRSSYGKMLDLPNGLWGMIYYAACIALLRLEMILPLTLLSFFGLLVSLWLLFVLITRVKAFCLDCLIIYSINILLFVLSTMELLF